jgi:hypothetical protein
VHGIGGAYTASPRGDQGTSGARQQTSARIRDRRAEASARAAPCDDNGAGTEREDMHVCSAQTPNAPSRAHRAPGTIALWKSAVAPWLREDGVGGVTKRHDFVQTK